MERMTMRTAGLLASAAGARLRALGTGVWSSPAPAALCPVYACAPSPSPLAIHGVNRIGNVKQGTTGGFRLTDHLARRHSERSP
jgi:hypothetical protein